MDYNTLKIIHLTSLALTFMGLSGILGMKLAGGATPLAHRLIFHVAMGLGWFGLVITGFALGAKLGLHSPPGWMLAKFAIWLVAGASMALATRLSRYAGAIVIFFALLVATAAWLAIDKPF